MVEETRRRRRATNSAASNIRRIRPHRTRTSAAPEPIRVQPVSPAKVGDAATSSAKPIAHINAPDVAVDLSNRNESVNNAKMIASMVSTIIRDSGCIRYRKKTAWSGVPCIVYFAGAAERRVVAIARSISCGNTFR